MPRLSFIRALTRTPRRTFLLYPAIVIAFEAVWRGSMAISNPAFLPLLAWGYLQYRLMRVYRRRHGAGSSSFGEMPVHLLETGPYALTRNPMYLGHLIFLMGLVLSFASWLGLLIFLGNIPWFHRRVLKDESMLRKKFGLQYSAYCNQVKRWIPFIV